MRTFMRTFITLTFVVLTCASSNANAWFFFFLPGSVTSKIADTVTGSEGDNCVGSTAKVGDIIGLPNGGTATIKSLSGTSSRCTQPERPIRALLDFSTPSFTSKAGINLPDEWKPTPLTDQQKFGGGLLMAKNSTVNDSGLYLGATKRKGAPDMMAVATNSRSALANTVAESQQSEIEQITVNGMRAWRYEVTGKTRGLFGSKYTYLTTIMEGDQEIVTVRAWTPADTFEKQKESLKQLAGNISGIEPPPSPIVATPSPEPVVAIPMTVPDVASSSNPPILVTPSTSPPAAPIVATPSSNTLPTQSENAASRLRELNALYKDGVINKNDFETKKQEILKAM